MFDEFGINAGYVEDLHTRWLQSPQSVEADWQRFFEGNRGAAEIAPPTPPPVVAKTPAPASTPTSAQAPRPAAPSPAPRKHAAGGEFDHVMDSRK